MNKRKPKDWSDDDVALVAHVERVTGRRMEEIIEYEPGDETFFCPCEQCAKERATSKEQ